MIPVFTPTIGPHEMRLVNEALTMGEISGSAGRFITKLEEKFAAFCGCRHGVAVSSGSTALHLACAAVGIQAGDEVLVSASTNIASANAVVQQGALVVPVDSEPDTWNMNPALLDALITPSTRAIMPVHLFGHPVDMDPVMEIARRRGLYVIEDCAEAHGAMYLGRKVGGIGDVGCFSFYANKVITCGEGGMLVTNDDKIAERTRLLRNLAFGQPRFKHEEIGYNYRLTNLQAAVAVGQLERINEILAQKRTIANWYLERLSSVPGLRMPVERMGCRNVYWMFALVVEREFGLSRDDFADELLSYGVDTRTMFCPMGQQPALLKRNAVRPTDCPQADFLWANGLYLPSGLNLTEYDVDAICHVVQEMSPACA